MSAFLLTGPAAEPLSLAEAKAYLRVEHDDDDAVIIALIAAARGQIEALTGRALLLQSWRLVRDGWPANGRIALRIGPLRALTAARVFDAAGVAHPIDVDSFVVDVADNAIAAPCWSLPAPGRAVAGIELDLELGFGVAGRCAGAAAAGGADAVGALVRQPRRRRVRRGAAAGRPRGDDRAVPDAVAMIDPGRLKTRLVIEAPNEADAGQGRVTRSYATQTTVWAAVLPQAARDRVEAGADGAVQRVRIILRRGVALTLRHRLIDGAAVYRIVGFRAIADGRFIEIDAELRVE